MAEWSTKMNQRIEALDRLIQEQQKNINKLKELLMQIIENTLKHTEDIVGGSSSDKGNKDKKILDSNGEGECGEEEFNIDPLQKDRKASELVRSIDAQSRFVRDRDYESLSDRVGVCTLPEKVQTLKTRVI